MFGAVKLNKNVNPDKYEYSGYRIGFVFRLQLSWADGSMGKISLFWEFMIVLLCMLMVETKTSYFLLNDQH